MPAGKEPIMNERMVTETEAAEYLGLARITLRKMRMEGRGPQFCKFSSRAIRYPMSALEQYVSEHMNRRGASSN